VKASGGAAELVFVLSLVSAIAATARAAAAAEDDILLLRVLDQRTGRPLDARVTIPGRDLVVRTTEDGTARLDVGFEGTAVHRPCVIRISANAYADVDVPCAEVRAGELYEVRLVPAPIRLHETVVVAASREETPRWMVPRATSVIDAEELAHTMPRTTPEALSASPGVWVQKTNHGGGSPFVRGLSGNQVLVLVDGIRLNNSTFRYGPNQYLATIDPTSLERIEVVRGAGSVLFGSDALGGVINLVTRRPELSSAGRRLSGRLVGRLVSSDMEQSARAEVSAASARVAAVAGLSLRRYGDLRAGGALGVEAPSGYGEVNGDARVLAQVASRTVLTAGYHHVHQDDVPRYDQVAQRGFARWSFDPQARQLAWTRITHATHTAWANTVSMTSSWQRSFERRERQARESPLLVVEEDTVDTVGLLVEGRGAPRSWLAVRYGLDVYRDRIRSGRIDRDTASGAVQARRGLYPDGARAGSTELFAVASVQHGRFLMDAGARRTWTSVEADDALFGRLALAPAATIGSLASGFRLGGGWSLYGTVAQAFRAPNVDDVSTLGAFDFGVEVPGLGLVPERSVSLEGGVKLQTGRAQLTAAAWRLSLVDLIDRVRSTYLGLDTWEGQRVYRRANVGEAYVRGTDVEGRLEIAPGRGVSGFLAHAYGQQTTAGQPMRRIPPLNGRAALWWTGRRGDAELSLRFAGRQDRLAPGDRDDHRINPLGTPGWTVLDLRASWTVAPAVKLVGGAGNLLDEAYRVHGSGIDGYGRHAWIGIELGSR